MKKYKKSLLVIGLVIMGLISVPAVSAQSSVTFQWDTNDEPDLAGYRLWQSDISGNYDQTQPPAFEVLLSDPLFDHTGDTCQWELPDVPDGTYFWVLTAFDTNGNESGFSNEVMAALDSTSPVPPGGLLIDAVDKMIAALNDIREYLVITQVPAPDGDVEPSPMKKVNKVLLKFNSKNSG